jgi:hypothetical protein
LFLTTGAARAAPIVIDNFAATTSFVPPGRDFGVSVGGNEAETVGFGLFDGRW